MDADQETKTTANLDVSTETSGSLSPLSADDSTTIDVNEIGKQLRDFVDTFPKQVGETYSIYKKPLNLFLVISAAAIAAAVANGVLDVLNSIPFVAPLLELIGLGYSAWFAWNYLTYAEKRQKLVDDYRQLKDKVTGGSH
ncbi:CAAD domain-containing protein [Acaryochloris marina NIES-2412]|uniref:CAAD domain-containing protein n=1 Tax=Acaryochloris marina TaxID=155978 RepID=UPI00405999E7